MNSVRNFLCTILLCLCLSPLIHAQALFSRDAEDLQTAAAATGNGTALIVRGWGGAIIQVTGTFSATLTIEGTVDGTNWVTLRVMNVSDGNFVTSVTATGVYAIATAGIETIRARVSAYTSGTVTVKGRGSVAVIARSSGGSSSLTVGTTAITGGTIGRVFFHDTGDVMGEYPVTGTAGNAVLSISPNLTGAPTITSTSNPCFAVGPNGATNPTLSVNCSVASAATGILVTGNATGAGVDIAATGGPNEPIRITPRGTGAAIFPSGAATTPSIAFTGATTNGFYRTGDTLVYRINSGSIAGLRLESTDRGVTLFGQVNTLHVNNNVTAVGDSTTTGGGLIVINSNQTVAYGAITGTGSTAGVLRVSTTGVNSPSTGAGQLLLGTSTDTADAQLSVYSQSTTRPGLKLRAVSGTASSQNVFESYDASGSLTANLTAAGVLSAVTIAVSGSLALSATGSGRLNVGLAGGFTATTLPDIAQFGGTSSSFPALKRSSAALEVRLADDSAYAAHRALTYSVNNACVIRSGAGTPESAVTGNVCDLYLRTDGGASTTLWIKESGTGNTGWIAK